MLGVLQGFAIILFIIGAGYLAAVFGIVKGDQRRVLSDVSFYVALPALLFDVLHRSEPEVLRSPVILVTTAAAIPGLLMLLWLQRRLRGMQRREPVIPATAGTERA